MRTVGFLTGILLVAASSAAQGRDVTFKAVDGFALAGSLYPAEKGGPGILLLHQCNADRRVYDDLATMLNVAGYNVLSFDFRGFGGSKSGEYTNFAAQRDKILATMPGDVDAALNFLTAQKTANSRALGIVGGSCGVNQAVHAAQRRPEIRTLVLLSGGSDAEGDAYIKDSTKIPLLGIASEEDTEAAAAVARLVRSSTSPYSAVQIVKDAGHAAFMFAKQPDLLADVVVWFRSNLAVGGYGLPPAIK